MRSSFKVIYVLMMYAVTLVATEPINQSLTPILSYLLSDSKVTSITPSLQTSDEIKSIIKSGEISIPYTNVETNIKNSSGTGPYYGVDDNGKLVVAIYTFESYFGDANWVFCHESDMTCHRVIDTSNKQRLIYHSLSHHGKIFFSVLDKDADSSPYGAALDYYDTNTKEFVKRAHMIGGLNGETRSMSLGADGFIYVGGSNFATSNHYASYEKIDPDDLSNYEYHTGYYTGLRVDRAREIAADNEYVYQIVGDNPFEVIAVNQSTQVGKKVLDIKSGNLQQFYNGVGLRYVDSNGASHNAWLYKGALTNVENFDKATPWPENDWAALTYFELEKGVGKPKQLASNISKQYAGEDGMGELHVSVSRKIDGVDTQLDFSTQVDTYKQTSRIINAIDKNRILVTGKAYTGASIIKTKDADKAKYLHGYSMSPNIAHPYYDYELNKKRVIISGYGSVNTMLYDLDDTNQVFGEDNTHSLGYLRNVKDIYNPDEINDAHRPLDIAQVDEWLFMVAMQYRSGVGGSIIGINTKTKETFAIKKGYFDNYQPRSIAKLETTLAIATQANDNREFGGLARPSTPKVYIFDPKTRSIIKEYKPLEGLETISAGKIASIDKRHIIGISNDMSYEGRTQASKTFIYIIDTYTDEIVMKKTIDLRNYFAIHHEGSADSDMFAFKVHGDYIYTWMNARTLVRIDKNGTFESLALMPYQGNIGFSDTSMYITGGYDLLKIDIPK